MSSGRYMAYSPSPSTTPHSPRVAGLRTPSAAVAEQEKYLAELLAERHKLGPFIPVIPHSVRLLNQEILRVSTLLENASLLNQSGLEHGSPLTTGGLYSNGAATDMNGWTSAFQAEAVGSKMPLNSVLCSMCRSLDNMLTLIITNLDPYNVESLTILTSSHPTSESINLLTGLTRLLPILCFSKSSS